ncbi:MAG: type II secretion system F family protein [Planctomycetes bacterium]|nr:type II secretion system F family protein [Planctomycetota bacterium]
MTTLNLPLDILLPACLLVAAALFAYVGIDLFSRGWVSYEQRYVQGLERTLAALYLTFRPEQVLYLSCVSLFLFGGIGLLLTGRWAVAVVFAAAGFGLPRFAIRLMKRHRDNLFRQQLPGVVDAISRGLRSGLSLQQCLQLIEREMGNPAAQEFRVVNAQVRLGMPVEKALAELLDRMPGEDLDLVVTAVQVCHELGGSLPEVLENIGFTIRQRFQLQGKLRTLTSQGRLQAAVLSVMPLVVFLALHAVNPDLMRPMYTTVAGWMMIGGILVWESLGIFFLWKIVAIRV